MTTKSRLFKTICISLITLFTSSILAPGRAMASSALGLPVPTQMIPLSRAYSFPVLKGLKLDPENPLNIEFIIDSGNQKKVNKEEAGRLIKYFLAGLTIPEEDLWVNLSPYEKERVIPEKLAQTDLGKGLLSQDYILKQLSASITHPESATGKDFWSKTYKELYKTLKTTNIPVNTFNKIWITPETAEIYEGKNIALITDAKLKAMLEEDYLALEEAASNTSHVSRNTSQKEKINETASQIMSETILPKINNDINSGKNFATLRQIYHSTILASWFKEKFRDSFYKNYMNKGKIKGIDLEDKNIKDKVYSLYVEAFQKGMYDYVKTEKELSTNKTVKRRYFSGGLTVNASPIKQVHGNRRKIKPSSNHWTVSGATQPLTPSSAISEKPLKILVVDDYEATRYGTKKILELLGHTVETANNGQEALVKFKNNKYDIVTTDKEMPVMDGIELIKEIKKINSEIPIILISGDITPDDKKICEGFSQIELVPRLYPAEYLKKIKAVVSKIAKENSTPASSAPIKKYPGFTKINWEDVGRLGNPLWFGDGQNSLKAFRYRDGTYFDAWSKKDNKKYRLYANASTKQVFTSTPGLPKYINFRLSENPGSRIFEIYENKEKKKIIIDIIPQAWKKIEGHFPEKITTPNGYEVTAQSSSSMARNQNLGGIAIGKKDIKAHAASSPFHFTNTSEIGEFDGLTFKIREIKRGSIVKELAAIR